MEGVCTRCYRSQGPRFKKKYFFIFSTPKVGSDDLKRVGLISFIKCLLSTYYYACTTFTKTIAKLQNKKKGQSTRTERRRGFETVTILNFNLLLPMVGGGGIDF